MRAIRAAVAAMLTIGCAGAEERSRAGIDAGTADSLQAISLFGEALFAPGLAPEVRAEREAQLAEARAAYELAPNDADAIIWLGRRTAYLGDYRGAIAIYGEGIAKHPDDPRFYRHRGHRYITVREFDRASADLERAVQLIAGTVDQTEPDGMPNARNIPTSTLHFNVWYHLGLAYYLTGDFEKALRAYRECLAVSSNPDMQVATSHWLYVTLRRLGREAEAAAVLGPIYAGMDIIENTSYHRLLLMYRGELSADDLLTQAGSEDATDDATLGYAVGNWHLYNGRPQQAAELFRAVLDGPQWPAFGYIAAEADFRRLARLAP